MPGLPKKEAKSMHLLYKLTCQQCVFSSLGIACSFCQERGIESSCLKKLGEKTESSIAKLLPTPDDEIINPQDASLLQFVYTDKFAYATGPIFQSLLKAFSVIFGQSIKSTSLRQAMLA